MTHASPRRHRTRSALALLLPALWLALSARADPSPRREDFSDLIVLYVSGSWREMGRQQAELLGPVATEAFAFNRADYDRNLAAEGAGARLFDRVGVPSAAKMMDDDASGMGEHLAGLAEGLGVSQSDMLRASFALDAGSTVFVATRKATKTGEPLIGRNADWGDAGGRRRPVVTHFRPSDGSLAHVVAAWPLLTIPVVGLNEAGFALSMNYFDTEPLLEPFGADWPHRRALQTAHDVDEGIAVFTGSEKLGFACFMADVLPSFGPPAVSLLPGFCSG